MVAYRKVDGKETKLARSITAHVVGSGSTKYTNVKRIKLSKSSYTLKANQTAKIKAIGKGTCDIYVYAKNGYAKKVTVNPGRRLCECRVGNIVY